MNLIINPALKNFTAQPIQTNNLEEAQGFSKIFDEAIDAVGSIGSEDNEADKEEEPKVFNSANQSFGPPIGLSIEDFDYSMI